MARTRQSAPDDDLVALACACATIRRASRAVTQLYDGWLRQHGVEGPQFALLTMLDRHGPCNQAAIARWFDLDKTTLSRNLKLLERQGWVEFADGADARQWLVSLTAAGKRRLAAASPAWQSAQKELRAALGGGDWDSSLRAIDGLTRAARAARRTTARKPASR